MNLRTATWAALALTAAGVLAAPAAAYDGPYFARWGGANWLYPSGNLYVQEAVPYFALHPPVYYSYPVARTYGFSPFPYPPDVITPQYGQPSPVLWNPLAVAAAASADAERPPMPQRMDNPYVKGEL